MSDSKKNKVESWADLASSLYDKLTGKNAEITYEFHKMTVQVPDSVGSEAIHTPWVLDGKIIIRTKNLGS